MKTLALLFLTLIFSAYFIAVSFVPPVYAWQDCQCMCGTNTPVGRTDQSGTCQGKCSDGSSPWYSSCHDTTDPAYGSYYGQIPFTPSVQIPGYTYDTNKPGSTYNIATYIKAIYNYGVGIVGILAAVGIMVGGFIWLTAGGNASKVGEAQAWIGSSISGLALVMFAYLILNTINPALVNFKISTVKQVAPDAATQKELDKQQKISDWQNIKHNCDSECSRWPGTWNYDRDNNRCECYGDEGKHLECNYLGRCMLMRGTGPDTCSLGNICAR
jgi:hypothetical protein